MDARKLLHKLARHRYYEAHKHRALAEQCVEISKQKLSELACARIDLSYRCSDDGILVFTEQCKDLHKHNTRKLNHAQEDLAHHTQERYKWQILESRASCKTLGEKKRVINDIEDDMLQIRYQSHNKRA